MTLVRDPVLHFVVLGAAVFAVAAHVDRHAADEPDRIVVTRARIEQLAADFAAVHRRPPSPDERRGLIREYLHEEVSYREAVALGLDRDDPVIRHRLRQKVEFVFDDVGALTEPTDAQLEGYREQHADAFRREVHVAFEHVYLDPQRRSTSLAGDAAVLLAQLRRRALAPTALGDPFLLEHRFDATAASDIAALFGERFASALQQLPLGRWHGPIESGYGAHLVYVRARTPAGHPPLDDIRDAVRREWLHAQRQTAREKLYAGLLARYAVTVDATVDGGREAEQH